MKKYDLLELMRARSSVFTTREIALLWARTDPAFVRKKLHRYVQSGKLYSLRKGIYAKIRNYEKYEVATKILTPAYVSFETVLARAGIVFQFYGQIFVASYLQREMVVDGQTYAFKKIKDSVLTNKTGIEARENYFIASPERAFLDVLYLNKDYYFDRLDHVDWAKVEEILPIYKNKRMEKKVQQYRKDLVARA